MSTAVRTNSRVEEARDKQTDKVFLPPCQIACPIGEDIQRTNVQLAALPSDVRDAHKGILRVGDEIYDKNPLFMVCGYVCGLCEKDCNYKDKGGSIRRRLLKRFVADNYLSRLAEREPMAKPRDGAKIAVIGGGPGGLMCAFDLGKRGYKVTIFERGPKLGGAVRAIPKYRLPIEILDGTIDNLVRIAGVEVRTNTEVKDFEALRKEGFKAIFVATGTPYARPLNFEGKPVPAELEGVFLGLEFLWEANREKLPKDMFKNKKVIVVGGGNVAFDVARTARRLGGAVEMVCLECADKTVKDGIPADEEEIEGAHEEGIKVNYSRGVSEVVGDKGKFKGIKCPKCVGVFDDKGFNPKFKKDDVLQLQGDVLIVTIGQGPDRALYQKEGLLSEKGRLEVDPVTLAGLKKGVFIGGDVKRIGFAADAMRDGLAAAESIDRLIKGADLKAGREKKVEKTETPESPRYKEQTKVAYFRSRDRVGTFDMVEKGFTLHEAIREAKRCLCCGPCKSCKACVLMNLQTEIREIEVNKDICSGCAICLSVCPYGAIEMKEETGHTISVSNDVRCKRCGVCVTACPAEARDIRDDLVETKDALFKNLAFPVTKGSIMIVDDEDIIRKSLAEWFRDAGFSTVLAEDGRAALKTLATTPVDAVFLDLKMPGMNGIEVLKEIREKRLCPNVIMITAYGTIQNAVEAMKIGAIEYVVKPFEPADLQKVAETVIGV
ncbi:MAG: response regulator [Planctomycetota bacterium]|nr:response regulator [Planctomycetota bacterium]